MIKHSISFEMFKNLAAVNENIIFVTSVNLNSIVIEYCNKAFEDFFKVAPSKCEGVDIYKIFNIKIDLQKKQVEDFIFNTGVSESFDLLLETNSRDKVWTNFSIKSYIENNLQYNVWIQSIYSNSKEFKQELTLLENYGKDAMLKIEEGLDPVCFVDFKGKLIFANNTLLRALEFTAHELLNTGILSVHSQAIIYGSAKDITQSKYYDVNLKESNERYSLLSKATNDVMYEWDVKKDIIYWNDSFTRIFGHHLLDLTSNHAYWSSYLHPADIDRVRGNLDSAKIKLETNLVNEYRFKTSEGKYKNILDRGILIFDENKELIKMVGAMQDITLLKESEFTLEQLNNTLQQRTRQLQDLNKELEQFAYIVSHDLQEPLRMISSFMQLLLSENETSKTEKTDLYINFAIDGANRMKMLIQDLLTYSRVGATEEDFVEIDCNTVLKETLQIYNQRITALNAQIIYSPLPKIKAIHSLIGQVFDNLISNALKYNDKSYPILEISYSESPTHFILEFKDNGIGIDNRFANLIYMPFKRLHSKQEYSGTGIGLAVVKKIAEKHSGHIWLESKQKIGSTFFVSFKK
jgi:PAS domain S-box-containing protein